MPTVSFAKDPEKPDEYQELEVELHQSLYDECERQGVELPHGCLAGSCGSCRVDIVEGLELLKDPSVIEQNTIEALKEEMVERYGADSIKDKNIRLSCRAKMKEDGKVIFKAFK